MLKHLVTTLAVLSLLFAGVMPAAYAELARVGPVGFGGYPAWYQDKTGLVMEFCSPTNASERDGGWCLLLTADVPVVPEVFPTNFFDEHFYWAAGADLSKQMPNGGKALLTMALEGAFAVGPVIAGDQIVFGRLRIVINPVPVSGTYTVYTPFGVYTFPDQAQGSKLFFTEDIGIQCPPGDFTCALASKVGPFLLPSATPGGGEVPPVPYLLPGQDPYYDVLAPKTAYPATGKIYVADPARVGPVTGSTITPFLSVADNLTYNHNIFRIEGPGVVLSTYDFTLMGRVYEGPISGSTTVDRASYARSSTATPPNKVDVYATAFPTTQGRVPASTAPAIVPTSLAFYDAPCATDPITGAVIGPPAGFTPHQMNPNPTGSNYFGQSNPAAIPANPAQVCVQANATNAAGQTVTTYIPTPLGDQVFITEGLYDPTNKALSVKATSSDLVAPPTLTVAGFGAIDPLTGQVVIPALDAPPATVTVNSSAGGQNKFQVSTGTVAGFGGGSGTPAPVAANDTASVDENCSATASATPCATALIIDVLANDHDTAGSPLTGATVIVGSKPLLGTAVVNANGTIGYTPKLFASGTDSFTYVVTVGTQTSNTATVTVTINHINQTPTAVNDAIFAANNKLNSFNVLANDSDPDGAADLAAAVIVTGNATLGITAGTVFAGGNVSFTPTSPGTYTFTYQAVDKAIPPLSSNTATATVSVNSAENITVSKSQYVVSKNRWVISGTDSIPAGQTISFFYANGSLTGFEVGMTAVDALGNWVFDVVGLTGNYDPRNSGATRLTIKSSLGGTASATINLK